MYVDSVGHATIGIGFDVTDLDNLQTVLSAMGISWDEDGTNGQIFYDALRGSLIFGRAGWTTSNQNSLRSVVNQTYTEYLIAEGSQTAEDPQAIFTMSSAQIATAFTDIVGVREAALDTFLTAYDIDLDGDLTNNDTDGVHGRLPLSNERLALLSLLYNSTVYETGHINAGMPKTLTSNTVRGGNLVAALQSGDRIAPCVRLVVASNFY